MPKGPDGQKRPGDIIGCAVEVAKIATGEIEDNLPSAKRNGGKIGGRARAAKLSSKRRSEIASKAAQSRWKS